MVRRPPPLGARGTLPVGQAGEWRTHSSSVATCCVQAEDCIRYLTVTGVQTCALPIWIITRGRKHRYWKRNAKAARYCCDRRPDQRHHAHLIGVSYYFLWILQEEILGITKYALTPEIGRAHV